MSRLLSAAVLLVLLGSACSSGGSSPLTPTSQNTATSASLSTLAPAGKETGTRSNPVPVGQPETVGPLTVTVVKVTPGADKRVNVYFHVENQKTTPSPNIFMTLICDKGDPTYAKPSDDIDALSDKAIPGRSYEDGFIPAPMPGGCTSPVIKVSGYALAFDDEVYFLMPPMQ